MSDMTTRETERERATRRVMRTLTHWSATNRLPVRLEDGTSPVVIALPDDPMEEIEARRLRMGGYVNLVVAYPEYMLLLRARDEAETDETAEIAPFSSVAMLVAWLQSTEKKSGSFRIRPARHVMPTVEQLEYAF